MYALRLSSTGKTSTGCKLRGWASPPPNCIPKAVPHATKLPINYYKDSFESSCHESDNKPTLVITSSHDATMPTVPLGFTLVFNIVHVIL